MQPIKRSRLRARAVPAASLAVSIALFSLWPATAGRAACLGSSDPLAKVISQAGVVFVGTVASVDRTHEVAQFDVEEIWRGPNLPESVPVNGGGMPPYRWQIGLRYLVIPAVTDRGELVVRGCWPPTSVYRPEFDALRPANAHPPQGPPTSGPPGSPPLAAVFLAILMLGSVGAFLLYRRGGGGLAS